MKQTVEKQWITKSGYEAIVKHIYSNDNSWRCGYILIPETSALHGLNAMSSYLSVSELNLDDPNVITKLKITQAICNIEVHGGITLAGKINYKINESFAFGFDCAHSGDTLETCTLDYCVDQCEQLASQLSNIELLNTIKPVEKTSITNQIQPSNQLLSAVLNLTVVNAFPSIDQSINTNTITIIYEHKL